MKNQIRFNDYKSYEDFGLVLISKSIGSPAVKKKKVDIEGADGELDFTELFGYPTYDNRPIDLGFQMTTDAKDFLTQYSTINNALNGQKVRIVFEDDPDFYYIGRLKVEFTNDRNQGYITISCDCEPYKYRSTITVVTQAISGSADIVLNNLKKRTVPTITCNSNFAFEWDGFSTSVAAGRYVFPELELAEGDNTVTVTGTGIVTFEYQEGGM